MREAINVGQARVENDVQLVADTVNLPSARLARQGVPRASADALDIPEQFVSTVVIRRSREIYHHDAPADFCWNIVAGCVRQVRSMKDGRRQISEFRWPGDLLGIDDCETHFFGAEAVTDVTLRRYPRKIVEANARIHAGLALRLRMMAMQNLLSAHRHVVTLGRKTAVERIASFLLEMERQPARADSRLVKLPMSRTDIADHLGLSIETVCRNLGLLQRQGTLAILRSGIELLDRAALSQLMDDSDA